MATKFYGLATVNIDCCAEKGPAAQRCTAQRSAASGRLVGSSGGGDGGGGGGGEAGEALRQVVAAMLNKMDRRLFISTRRLATRGR